MKTYLLLLIILGVSTLQVQGQALELNYQGGTGIRNHPRFPDVKPLVHNFELNYTLEPYERQYWSIFHRFPTLSLSTSIQTMGSAKVLGQAFTLAPIMGFYLLRREHWRLQGQLGLGLAYISKRFDSFYNPTNIVIGTSLNAYATVRLRLAYRVGNWEPNLGFVVAHYSNSNAMSPNLGINIPSLQVGLRYHLQSKTVNEVEKQAKLSMLPDFKQRWTFFLQGGIGMSAAISRGPLFPCYTAKSGAAWKYSRKGLVEAGLEYSFNGSSYNFRLHNNPETTLARDFNRYAVFLAHELLFGHFGFYTLGGIYLNKHIDRRSLIATQVGLNFYPRSTVWFHRHQIRIGVNIRAYFGLAEFALLEIGYRF